MQGSNILRISLACLLYASLALAQTNYVEDYDFDSPPPRQHRPAPQSFRPSPQSPGPRPTPVPILKQIDRHNEDGSYTYGYEGADGSFKIETKLVTGEVMGKYGYVDDAGKVRVVEYGANRYGFMPAGEGITVAPPTLVDETTEKNPKGQRAEFVDDGSYYHQEEPLQRPAPRPAIRPAAPRPRPQPQPQPQPQFDEYVPAPAPAHRRPQPSSVGPAPPRPSIPGAVPAPVFSPAPVYEEVPQPQHRSFGPPPQRPQPQRSFSAPQPQILSRPEPRYESLPPLPPRPQPAPQPQPSHRAAHGRGSSSILDQLERDYALPQGSSQLTHDISFGSY